LGGWGEKQVRTETPTNFSTTRASSASTFSERLAPKFEAIPLAPEGGRVFFSRAEEFELKFCSSQLFDAFSIV
jgi:hypothetical protein